MKFCNGCQRHLSRESFHRNGQGLKSKCRECVSLQQEAYRERVRDERNARKRDHYATNSARLQAIARAKRDAAGPAVIRQRNVKHFFNLEPEQLDAMFEAQGRRCAICGTTEHGGKNWHVDHDTACCPTPGRSCGKCVRGLLCARCNPGIAMFQDDPERLIAAASYLLSTKDVLSMAQRDLPSPKAPKSGPGYTPKPSNGVISQGENDNPAGGMTKEGVRPGLIPAGGKKAH